MDDQRLEDAIRRRAYELWERQGSPEGRADEFWESAKDALKEDDAQRVDGTAGTPLDR